MNSLGTKLHRSTKSALPTQDGTPTVAVIDFEGRGGGRLSPKTPTSSIRSSIGKADAVCLVVETFGTKRAGNSKPVYSSDCLLLDLDSNPVEIRELS